MTNSLRALALSLLSVAATLIALLPAPAANAVSWISWQSPSKTACDTRMANTITDLRRQGYVIDYRYCRWLGAGTTTHSGLIGYYRPKTSA